MKSKWQFPFEAVGVYFEKAHHFNVRAKTETDCVVLEAAFAEHGAEVFIEPSPNSTGRPGTQRGYVRISLVGTPEATEAFAYWMASSISEHIAFQHRGQFRINYGFVAAERIPESPEEAASIGDGRHYVTVSSQEVDEGKPFDPAALTQLHAFGHRENPTAVQPSPRCASSRRSVLGLLQDLRAHLLRAHPRVRFFALPPRQCRTLPHRSGRIDPYWRRR